MDCKRLFIAKMYKDIANTIKAAQKAKKAAKTAKYKGGKIAGGHTKKHIYIFIYIYLLLALFAGANVAKYKPKKAVILSKSK